MSKYITINDTIVRTPADRPYDGYEHLEAGIRESFEDALGPDNKEPLFFTNVENLYDIFLDYIPEEARQHYNCNACRNFVNRYGGLVTIDDDGYTYPAMWNFVYPEFFSDAIVAVFDVVKKAIVTGVFIPSERHLGVARTGIWTHMSVDVPKNILHNSKLNTAHQVEAEKDESYRMLARAIRKYKISTIENAVSLLRTGVLYRSEKFLGIVEWFLDVKNAVNNNRRRSANVLWKKAITAPAGFCSISSNMVGTLLDDIDAGYSFTVIQNRFNEKVDPLRYQRPQVAPGKGNVARAEEIIAKLGLENSLKRRYARLDEIETIWKPNVNSGSNVTSGVFADVKTKESYRSKTNEVQGPTTIITWDKFRRTVLPTAKKIEFYVPYGANSYAALVTAEDQYAPPIIAWDTEEHRNPFSWYLYAGGSDPHFWNLPACKYVEVTGITLQPNLWQPGYEHNSNGAILILKDCKDRDGSRSLALFPELLRGELREVRSTIEAYSKTRVMSGLDEASACGLSLQAGTNKIWKCELRVTTDVGVSKYKLDRWD